MNSNFFRSGLIPQFNQIFVQISTRIFPSSSFILIESRFIKLTTISQVQLKDIFEYENIITLRYVRAESGVFSHVLTGIRGHHLAESIDDPCVSATLNGSYCLI